MYASVNSIFDLSNKCQVQGCDKPIIREHFDFTRRETGVGNSQSTYQTLDNSTNWYYDTPPPKKVQPQHSNSSHNQNDHSISPDVWGPKQWASLHYSASGYEDDPNTYTRTMMKMRLQALPTEIPCTSCRSHCAQYINNSNLDKAVSSREELFNFYFNFHNAVNKRLQKPELDLQTVKHMYSF